MAVASKHKSDKERRSFGDAVASLLDTYSRCLALLKGFGRGGQSTEAAVVDDAASLLTRSIRSDRTDVRRAYTSGLKRRGASFARGDAVARSSLRRVVRKLTSTLANLMRTFTRQPIDHESLMSLSNASRLDAIRTMTDLSSRAGSSTSLRSTRSRKSTKSRKSTRKTRSRDREPESQGRSSRHRSKGSRERPKSDRLEKHHQEPHSKRVSMATISSGSTKLGEIRASRVQNSLPHKVTYPLYLDSLQVRHGEADTRKKKRWFGLF